VIKVEGGEQENRGTINMPRRHTGISPIIFAAILVVIGIALFVFGAQLAVYTSTNLNYSAFGAFIFLAGLLIYLATRPKGRRR
jgi:membrane protein implicated in regulation of membrane protease activity